MYFCDHDMRDRNGAGLLCRRCPHSARSLLHRAGCRAHRYVGASAGVCVMRPLRVSGEPTWPRCSVAPLAQCRTVGRRWRGRGSTMTTASSSRCCGWTEPTARLGCLGTRTGASRPAPVRCCLVCVLFRFVLFRLEVVWRPSLHTQLGTPVLSVCLSVPLCVSHFLIMIFLLCGTVFYSPHHIQSSTIATTSTHRCCGPRRPTRCLAAAPATTSSDVAQPPLLRLSASVDARALWTCQLGRNAAAAAAAAHTRNRDP